MYNLEGMEKPQPLTDLYQLINEKLSEPVKTADCESCHTLIWDDLSVGENECIPSYDHEPSIVKPCTVGMFS